MALLVGSGEIGFDIYFSMAPGKLHSPFRSLSLQKVWQRSSIFKLFLIAFLLQIFYFELSVTAG